MGLIRTKVLGKGTNGTVFKAIPMAIGRNMKDVKVIKSTTSASSFKTEESILKLFNGCDEIVKYFNSEVTTGNDGKLSYNLILEFAPNGTLHELINGRPILERHVSIYTSMILKGLSCIHINNVVHCDLKPTNILVFPNTRSINENDVKYRLKITDFGNSRTQEETIYLNGFWRHRFRGTPIYTSPESVRLGMIETPMDIWSLGCIVIEMLTGSHVWSKFDTCEDIMFQLVMKNEAPQMPSMVTHHCVDFLNKCFEMDPARRWTADMLLNHPFILNST